MARDPMKIQKRKRMQRRPYTREMSFAYDYKVETSAPTKTELKLYRNRYTKEKIDKIIRNPFQKTGFVGLRRKK
jgi:hypothetical protein